MKIKTINYRGGIVSFEIPSHWKEDYDAKGGGTFYEDRADSGTLRLNVLSASTKDGSLSEDLLQRQMAKEPHEILKCGFPLKRYMKKAEENGNVLHIYRWEVSIPVPPTQLRVACFAHTVVAGQESDSRIKEELDLIDELVRTARFSTVSGVAGEHHPD